MKNIFIKTIKIVLVNIILVAVLTILLELFLSGFLHFPSWNKFLGSYRLRTIFNSIYLFDDRFITKDFSQYDLELTYTVEPNLNTIYKNREYRTHVETNSKGFRDDEESLDQPDMIVLGDSFTFGVGVEQNQTFADLIEKKTGLKVLNTGIESYGTAREITLLKHLDTRNLKYLLIQYHHNDLSENTAYIEKGFVQKPIYAEQDYEQEYRTHKRSQNYYFGKYIFKSIEYYKASAHRKTALDAVTSEKKKETTQKHVRTLVQVLNRISFPKNVQLILTFTYESPGFMVEFLAPEFDPDYFYESLREALIDPSNTPLVRRTILINTVKDLTQNDYYILDDHLNASGHQKYAQAILKYLEIDSHD